MTKPTIRELDDGSVVVDFGRTWFRCHPSGAVMVKEAVDGKVVTREATSKERLVALGHAAFDQ